MGLKKLFYKVYALAQKARSALSRKRPKKQLRPPSRKPKQLTQSLQVLPSRSFPELPKVPVINAIEEFSLVQLSPHSRRAYAQDLRDFFAFLRTREIWNRWNEELTPLLVAEYREYLSVSKGLAKSSVTRKLAVLKSFCRWALSRGWLAQNPAELVRSYPQTQDSKTAYLNLPETRKLLDSFPRELSHMGLTRALDRVVVETLLMLGLRRSEAASIHMKDIERLEEAWVLRVHGKGDRERVLPIPERLMDTWTSWLRRLHSDHAPSESAQTQPHIWMHWFRIHAGLPLLVSSKATSSDVALSSSEVARCVRRSARKAGIVQRVSPHALRATAITHALDEGASHRGVQQMAGWTSPLMITRYDKRRKDHRFSAIHSLTYAKRDAAIEDRAEECQNKEQNQQEKPFSLG
jgi:site-specific recombinase XerD